MIGKAAIGRRDSWKRLHNHASRVALLYAVAGSLWIFFSDRALEWLFATDDLMALGTQQTLKGLGFIAVTAISLYVIIERASRRLRRTETVLNLAEASLALMVQEASDYALILLDPDGRVRTWNRGAEAIKGYAAEEVIGQPVALFYEAIDRDSGKPQRLLEQALRDGSAVEESWRVKKDGSRFLASVVMNLVRGADGSLLGFACLVRDVTERRRQQRHLEQTQERLQLALQSVELGISDSDLAQRRIVFSAGWLALFGYDEGDGSLSVQAWEERVHPEDLPVLRAQIDRVLAEAPNIGDAEYRFRCADGRYRRILTKGRALLDGWGRPARLLASHLDVTDRHETEARLRKAQRLEAVGQLAGGVAHDFNNLLTVVLGNAELLCEQLSPESEEHELAQVVYAAADRGASLARRLLSFTREDDIGPQETAPSRLVEMLVPLLQRTLGGAVELRLACASDAWPVVVDQHLLENALINLAANARDAMEEGGVVKLSVENRRRATDSALSGPVVEISLLDEGCGMAPEVVQRALEAFYTTKAIGKGSGLGLSMVHDFVRQSGGEVALDSEPGKGTCVTLRLPAMAPPESVSQDGEGRRSVAGAGERVLLVEDDAAVRRLITDLLESLGYRVTAAGDAEEGLEQLLAEEPDLLVTDVTMPGEMSGLDLMREARRRLPHLPLLVVSGHLEGMEDLSTLPGSHVLHLQKPFTRRELSRAIRDALERAG